MGLPGIVALMAINNLNSSIVSGATGKRSSYVSPGTPLPNRYGDEYREHIIRSVIRRARPSLFGWFDICPLNEACGPLNIPEYNDAYRFLHSLHCVGYFHIPRAIRKRIPELIREALTPARRSESPEKRKCD